MRGRVLASKGAGQVEASLVNASASPQGLHLWFRCQQRETGELQPKAPARPVLLQGLSRGCPQVLPVHSPAWWRLGPEHQPVWRSPRAGGVGETLPTSLQAHQSEGDSSTRDLGPPSVEWTGTAHESANRW